MQLELKDVGSMAQIIITIITLVWFFAKLDKKIAINQTKTELRLENLDKKVDEIKNNHLKHLSEDLKCLSEKFNTHLIEHDK